MTDAPITDQERVRLGLQILEAREHHVCAICPRGLNLPGYGTPATHQLDTVDYGHVPLCELHHDEIAATA